MCMHMCLCMGVWAHMCIGVVHVFVCACLSACVHVCAFMYVCVHACVFVRVCAL